MCVFVRFVCAYSRAFCVNIRVLPVCVYVMCAYMCMPCMHTCTYLCVCECVNVCVCVCMLTNNLRRACLRIGPPLHQSASSTFHRNSHATTSRRPSSPTRCTTVRTTCTHRSSSTIWGTHVMHSRWTHSSWIRVRTARWRRSTTRYGG
jgi:hypothetical protein